MAEEGMEVGIAEGSLMRLLPAPPYLCAMEKTVGGSRDPQKTQGCCVTPGPAQIGGCKAAGGWKHAHVLGSPIQGPGPCPSAALSGTCLLLADKTVAPLSSAWPLVGPHKHLSNQRGKIRAG